MEIPAHRIQSEPRLELPERIAEWKLEPELACPIPRRVMLRWRYRSHPAFFVAGIFTFLGWSLFMAWRRWNLSLGGVLFGAVIFVALVALVFYFDEERELSRLLVSSGTATRGIIVKIMKTYVPRGGSDLQYDIAYDTPARRYISIAFIYHIPPRGFTGRKVGDTLTVLYLPEAPEKAMAYSQCNYKAVASEEGRE